MAATAVSAQPGLDRPTRRLHDLGQRIWLDHITRGMLDDGTLARYVDELSVTGLTSNPTIFASAIGKGDAYDATIGRARPDRGAEDVFFDLALEDLTRAADLFRPVHDATGGADGWVSLELSPLLAYEPAASAHVASELHRRADRPNLFIKIPGTAEGLWAIEQSTFAGVPINVTLLFSREQYLAAAHAFLSGIERRLDAGLDPRVRSVASLFVSRWDKAVASRVPADLKNRLGIAVAKDVHAAYRELLASDRVRRVVEAGAAPQRLLFASTGTKDPAASDVLYVEALAAPDTIDTMPEQTLLAFDDHGRVGPPLPADAGDAPETIARFAAAGIDLAATAIQLQREGADAFTRSWRDLTAAIDARRRG